MQSPPSSSDIQQQRLLVMARSLGRAVGLAFAHSPGMTSKWFAGAAVLVAMLTCGSPPTNATLIVRTTMMARAMRSDAVVIGQVRATHARWERGRIVTHADVEVESHIRGRAADRIDVVVPGGVVDGIGMRVLGAAELMVGDRALLFLTPTDRRDGRRHLIDLGAGKVAIEGDSTGIDRVRDERGVARPLADLVQELLR